MGPYRRWWVIFLILIILVATVDWYLHTRRVTQSEVTTVPASTPPAR